MFLQRFLRPSARSKAARPRIRPSIEVLEDRRLLADYTWSGPANGLWSNAANWTPNGVPGAPDTAIFNNTNNNNSVMDVPNILVGKLQITGHTGTIKLRHDLDIDVLVMSSGKIVYDGGTLIVSQVQAQVGGPSSWTGGTLGDSYDFKLTIRGNQQNPMTFNIGAENGSVEFGGVLWFIDGPASVCSVNWAQGDIKMADVGTTLGGGEIRNLGTFVASSGGMIYSPVGKRWLFVNSKYDATPAELKAKDRTKQFIRCKYEAPGGKIIKLANLDGTPGTFTIDGEMIITGGSIEIQDGTIEVIGIGPAGRRLANHDLGHAPGGVHNGHLAAGRNLVDHLRNQRTYGPQDPLSAALIEVNGPGRRVSRAFFVA